MSIAAWRAVLVSAVVSSSIVFGLFQLYTWAAQ